MKFVALKELPQGQQPGEVFEANEDVGNVLILVGAARKADPDPALPTKDDTVNPTGDETTAPRPRGRYRRADLRADET